MKGKTLLCLALVASMLFGVFMIGPVAAPSTTIGVEPSSTIDLGLGPGSTFTVEIWIRNVANLAGLEFKLAYNTAVLTATSVTYGGIFGTGQFELVNDIYDADGYLHYGVMAGFGKPPFTGDGLAATITFSVDALGESYLDLYDTKLGDPETPPNPIVHTAIGGYFRNAPVSVSLIRKSAWPEHHHYSISTDEDASNDLFAIVSNDGVVDTWIKVVFTVTNSVGDPVGDFETTTMQLLAGEKYGHKGDARYKTAFAPPSVGKYYASAVCWADTDGDAVPDTSMGKTKTFSFSAIA
jgi:hypothetical protein